MPDAEEVPAGNTANSKKDCAIDASLLHSIINEDGLFAGIASFCDRTTMLRLCTASKAHTECRCKLAVRLALAEDPRRTRPVCDESEGWVNVLRERLALDTKLVFTTVQESLIESNSSYRTNVRLLSVHDHTPPFVGGICMGNQVMREGIHRVIFVGLAGRNFRFGVISPDRVSVESVNGSETDIYLDDTLDFAASHNISSPSFWSNRARVGLEFDTAKGVMTVYRKKEKEGQWFLVGSLVLKYKSEGYCWAGAASVSTIYDRFAVFTISHQEDCEDDKFLSQQ